MGRGSAILLAGLAAAVALPVLGLGLQLPLWLAAGVAAAVFGGLWLVLKPSRPAAPGFDDEALLDARSDTARELIADASAALDRLQKSQRWIKDPSMRAEVKALSEVGAKVVRDVKSNPDRAMAVRRLLSFYMPNAANLAEGWLALEARTQPSPERVSQTRDTMHSLGEAFVRFADDVAEPQLQALDLDLKVLNAALKSDLETAR